MYFNSALHFPNDHTYHILLTFPAFFSMFPFWVIYAPWGQRLMCLHWFVYLFPTLSINLPSKKVPPIFTDNPSFPPWFRKTLQSTFESSFLFSLHISSISKSWWLYLPNCASMHFIPFSLLPSKSSFFFRLGEYHSNWTSHYFSEGWPLPTPLTSSHLWATLLVWSRGLCVSNMLHAHPCVILQTGGRKKRQMQWYTIFTTCLLACLLAFAMSVHCWL